MRAAWLLPLALFARTPDRLPAQEPDGITVRGRIVDANDAPLTAQRVVLHRVLDAQGSTVAEAETAADGGFELTVAAVDTSALYFVATRYEGELYIGAPFRSGDAGGVPQIIRVGVPGTSASALLGGGATPARAMGRPLTNRNWLLFGIPLLGIAMVAAYLIVPRSRIPPRRALLIRVAELDERMNDAAGDRLESLRAERTRLMTQLRAD